MSATVGPVDHGALPYSPEPGRPDEVVGADGELRDHWRYVIGSLRLLGRAELADRRAEAHQLLRQDGAAHAGGSATGSVGAWHLDPVPLLLSSEEWSTIEAGLVQRAELLDLVLADLYGPQELVARGLLPPEVVHAHPGYLRPAVGATAPGPHRLALLAADLVRGDDGAWVVVGDRTRTPTGSGFALENRTVLSRVFPSLFRDAHVHRLAHYFRSLRTALAALAPEGRDDPRLVILTPGPSAPAYFEHSYLAAYLGYPLVEPADLTVRRGRVWLRTLDGLEQVDVIVRAVADERCDPLELDPRSTVGVPGLVEAARRGTVALANPLGASVLESPGLAPFLPAVCEHLLGRPLALPGPESWWCGTPAGRARVDQELHRCELVAVDDRRAGCPAPVAPLPPAELDRRRRLLADRPWRWIARIPPAGGTAPTFVDRGLEPRPVTLRAFLVAREGTYVALPGALARVTPPGGGDRAPAPSDALDGAWVKDTWVLASEPERQGTSLLPEPTRPGAPLVAPAARTTGDALPSRAAEDLFWIGRHGERVEQAIRVARAVLARVGDTPEGATPAWLHRLLAALDVVTGDDGALPALAGDPVAIVLTGLFDRERPGSLVNSVDRLVATTTSVRELLSADTWRVLDIARDELDRLVADPPADAGTAQRALSTLLTSQLALAGLAAESTVRDPVWWFLDGGRRLERAQLLVAVARAALVPSEEEVADAVVAESVLVANESLITYRRRFRARLQLGSVLDLLLADPTNPRGLAHQLDRLAEHGAALPRPARGPRLGEVERLVLDASTRLRLADLEVLGRDVDPATGRHERLDELLTTLEALLLQVGEAVAHHFLHVEASRRLDPVPGSPT